MSVQAVHTDAEIIAQSICSSKVGVRGWSYAVQRACGPANAETCTQICESSALKKQDKQTKNKQWRASAALDVYKHRPSSSPGTIDNPHIGLKVYQYQNIDATGCGPNFCCCYVPV